MIEKIEKDGLTYAIIIFKEFKADGIQFFTEEHYSQQLGYMNRPKNYVIEPHIHKPAKKLVTITQEVLFIKSGRVKVDFFTPEKSYFTFRILEQGDTILLASGGHGFEMLEASEIIEVKQGPYDGEKDKERF